MDRLAGAPWEDWAARAEHYLDRNLAPANRKPDILHRAMRYAVLGGGKRLRALLTYATGTMFGSELHRLDPPACAVELIHAYSLVHDDLPAMDDDDMRRGQPSCHRAFGEPMAILVGDALQSLAFEILSNMAEAPYSPNTALRLTHILASASGSAGMAGGQAIDISAESRPDSLAGLQEMHRLKTGALIQASVTLGAVASGQATDAEIAHLTSYADKIGLAFQISDDILDQPGLADVGPASDQIGAGGVVPSYVTTLGIDRARTELKALIQAALDDVRALPQDASHLVFLAKFVRARGLRDD